jgi:hypothetical protein
VYTGRAGLLRRLRAGVNRTGPGSRSLRPPIRPGSPVVPAGSFTTDITAIRKRARQKMEEEHADDLVDLLDA